MNRLKSYFCVYHRAIEVALIVAGLLMGGGVAGYSIGRSEVTRIVHGVNERHAHEVERLQSVHRTSMRYMSDRLQELIARQSEMASEIAQASRAARSAAATASGAAQNAAKANIRVKEVPSASKKPKSPFTEVDP